MFFSKAEPQPQVYSLSILKILQISTSLFLKVKEISYIYYVFSKN